MKLTEEMRNNISDATVESVMDYMNKSKKFYEIGTIVGHALIKFCRVGNAVVNNIELMDEIAESTRRIINKVLDESELLTDMAKKDSEFSESYIELYEYLDTINDPEE